LGISQFPNSSSLHINENFANTYEIQKENKVTYNSINNKENYFDMDRNSLKTDNFDDKNLPSYLENNKSTNNIIHSQEFVPKEEENVNNTNIFNLKDYTKSLKQSDKKQIKYQELDGDRSLYYNQNNDNNNDNTNSSSMSNITNGLNQNFGSKKMINDQKYYYKNFSKEEDTDHNNTGYKENIPYSSVTYEDNDIDSFNQKKSQIVIKKSNVDDKNKLIIVSKIDLQNISKTGIIKVVGVINGEDFVKNIHLDKLKDSAKKLMVKFEMNKDNEFVSAGKPDEFFVCAYHVIINNNNNNEIKSISIEKENDSTNTIDYFDCNEGDIQSTTSPTKANLFKAKSQVYNKTTTYYQMHSKPQVVSFATLDNETTKSLTNNNLSLNNDVKQYNKKISNVKVDNNNSNKPVKVKIIVPMEDRKNATKIKIMAMLKGQIKSEIINSVQEEFDKTGGYTISRTFAFDRNTDMGPIQIGDRFHACVIGQDLNPPEGSECEKKLIKHLDKPNLLAAR
jgi:hypothetical protein